MTSDAQIDALHGPGAAAAIDAAYADGTIFNDMDQPVPVTGEGWSDPPEEPMPDVEILTHAQTVKAQFDRLAPALRKLTKVMWSCSCGEMWSGSDIEVDVHRHAAYEPGTHRVTGPLFRDKAAETETRTTWAKEDTNADA